MTLDRIPVKDLPSRYGLGKTQFYARLQGLNITPQRQGTQSYITAEQLAQLDELHQFMLSGGTIVEFTRTLNEHPERMALTQSERSIEHPTEQLPIIQLLQALEAFALALNKDPLAPQRQLTEIADRQWVVSTSQLYEILGTKPREGTRLGFRLRKVGRSGREVAWKVEKSATVADLVEWHHSPLRP